MELQKLVAGSADKEEEILRFVRGTNVRAWELLGCHYLGDGIYRFRVWAPQARAVALVGDFNDWIRPNAPWRLSAAGSGNVRAPKWGNTRPINTPSPDRTAK